MSYYKTAQIVNNIIDENILKVLRRGDKLNLISLKLELTAKYPISLKVIDKRVSLLLQQYNNYLTLKNDEVVLVEAQIP